MFGKTATYWRWASLTLLLVTLLALCLFTGTVDIPASDTLRVLFGGDATRGSWTAVVLELRVPMTVTALLTGAALGVAGLLLQTTFNNPLAGPSILGVSTGASMGVAVLMLALPALASSPLAAVAGAAAGAAIVIVVLLGFSLAVRSSMMLLIVGIMLGYLTSSVIALLNFFATQEGVHSYVIWGLGNFSGVGSRNLLFFAVAVAVCLVLSAMLVKPLNALLLGERYAANVGTNVRFSRHVILIVSGALIAVTTAFCGPVGFIGLAIPHIARMFFRTSDHSVLLPAVMLTGAATGLLTLWLSTLPGDRGMLPVNAITPLIGIPVVIYVIMNRRNLGYFN